MSDFYHDQLNFSFPHQLLRDIEKDKQLEQESNAAYAAGVRKYWYFYDHSYCPACNSTDDLKWRQYNPKPTEWKDRHRYREIYDYCEG
jgi:hypothetical protein